MRVTFAMVASIAAVGMIGAAQSAPRKPGTPSVKNVQGRHPYFESLVSLPQHFRSWTLRDQDQIDSLKKKKDGPSRFFSYDPVRDAAKYYRPIPVSGGPSIPIGEQLTMPIGIKAGSVLVIHDFWYGNEWVDNRGDLRAMKTFQIRLNGDKRFWTHTNSHILGNRMPEVGQAHNSASLAKMPDPEGRTKSDPLLPNGVGAVGEEFRPHAGVWTRYFHLLEIGLPAKDSRFDAWRSLASIDAKGRSSGELSGTWTALSLWIADEGRHATRIHYRVPVDYFDLNGRPSVVSAFEYEFNTSTSEPALTGPLVGFGRNVVVLHDYPLPAKPEADERIFARPVR